MSPVISIYHRGGICNPPSLPLHGKMATPFQSFRTKITSEMVKKIARYSTNTQAIKSATTWQVLHHYVTNSNTYYNYNRNYPAVLKIRFAVSGKLKIWNAIAALITLLLFPHFYGHSPCAV
jgi:CPA2 family monovalent cation:H+ antiporter-2